MARLVLGTDESSSENLVELEEVGGVQGGLKAFLEANVCLDTKMIYLFDKGFKKYGWDRQVRRAFTAYLNGLVHTSMRRINWLVPREANDHWLGRDMTVVGHSLYPFLSFVMNTNGFKNSL